MDHLIDCQLGEQGIKATVLEIESTWCFLGYILRKRECLSGGSIIGRLINHIQECSG